MVVGCFSLLFLEGFPQGAEVSEITDFWVPLKQIHLLLNPNYDVSLALQNKEKWASAAFQTKDCK